MKVAVYIRVSTEEQATEGYSISAQKQRLKAYCIAQDWDISAFYVDEGISAKDMKRPQLQQMLQDIKNGDINCVLVYRLDRLTRSVLDLYKMLQMFEKYDCKFKSATEVYDTTTAIGRLFITLVAALAQWERENTGERIKMGLQEKVRQGKYAMNQRPFGYNLDLKAGKLSIHKEEAPIVKLISELYLKGYGANRICKYLNERKITTRDGNQWNDKPLMQILKNPIYCGTIKWGDVLAVDSVPPIIDKDTYNSIQRTIERRRSLSPKHISSEYIFSGSLKCLNCGHPMVGYKVYTPLADGQKKIYKNYRCLRVKSGECDGSRSISEFSLERAFLYYLERLSFTSVLDEIAATGEETFNEQNNQFNNESLQKEIDKIEGRKKKWQYAWSSDMISDDDFRSRMDEERNREIEVKNQIQSFKPQEEVHADLTDIKYVLIDIKRNWSELEDIEKKALVQSIVKRVHVGYIEKTLTVESVDFH